MKIPVILKSDNNYRYFTYTYIALRQQNTHNPDIK